LCGERVAGCDRAAWSSQVKHSYFLCCKAGSREAADLSPALLQREGS
jgi:hypothetical protein